MNREIKFRYWDGQSMNHYLDGWSDDIDFLSEAFVYLQSENRTIMQYTGLKDKNGIEIYEGDVLSTSFGQLMVIEYGYLDYKGIMFYGKTFRMGKDTCLFEGRSHCISQTPPPFSDTPNYEVIGNIYENPELVEV